MTFSKLGLPNMADDAPFANDAYKDRNGVQHAGPSSTFNRIIDYIFGVQSNADSEFTAVTSATGSVGVYKYRYTQLDETAFDGQSALVDGKEYVRRRRGWAGWTFISP